MPEKRKSSLNIQSFDLESIQFDCQFDSNDVPVIVCKEKVYSNILNLLEDFPKLREPPQLDRLALALNFLLQGIKFSNIDDIKKFQHEYNQRIESEKKSLQNLNRLSDYGIFDISKMHEPKIQNGNLVFFVREDCIGLPYQVTCPFPIEIINPNIKYEILPYI